jgi:hypothetical protein
MLRPSATKIIIMRKRMWSSKTIRRTRKWKRTTTRKKKKRT